MAEPPTWFEDELDTGARRPRRRLLLVLAIVAALWTGVGLTLLRDGGAAPGDAGPSAQDAVAQAGGAAGTVGSAVPDATEDAPSADGTAEPTDEHAAPLETTTLATPEATTLVGRDEAEAVALAVARAWLSDGGPDLAVPGVPVDRRAYLEHLALESIDLPSDDVAVARLLLVLLVRDDDRYTEAIVRRAAVPLTLTRTTVHPGGPPWWLPTSPDLTPAPPATTPVTAPEERERVAAAIAAAGYRDVDVTEVAVTDGGTVVASVTAVTPDGDAVDGPLWLHVAGDELLVLGGPHAPAGDDGRAPAS